jgi:predicted Zn-dependent protease
VIERGLLAAAAVAVGVFAVVWLHPARLEIEAQSIAERPPQHLSQRDVSRAAQLFESARAHNPDTRPVVREAGLLVRSGRTQEALRLLRPVVRREPDNLTAWALIATGARTIDPALAREAAARANALNPLAAQAR